MSLLTDALRLREERRSAAREYRHELPPLGKPRTSRWIIAVIVGCGMTVGIFVKGGGIYAKLEELVGVQPRVMTPGMAAKISGKKDELDPAKVESTTSVPPESVRTETSHGPDLEAKPLVVQVPLKRENLLESAPVMVTEGKKSGSEPPARGSEKGAEEKRPTKVAVLAEKKPVLLAEEKPVSSEVPSGGLKPMKVELAEMEIATETPQEREKKRGDEVEAFLRSLQVQGVRLQGNESRILVDGAAVGLGEKVGSMGLVLESVGPQKLIFSDSGGKKYPKSY